MNNGSEVGNAGAFDVGNTPSSSDLSAAVVHPTEVDDVEAFGVAGISSRSDLSDDVSAHGDKFDFTEMVSLLDDSEFSDPPELKSEKQMLEYMKAQIKKRKSAYCYIRCLCEEDQDTFIHMYVGSLFRGCQDTTQRRTYIASGGIKMVVWRRLMSAIAPSLHHRHHLYRYAYWGENKGRKTISEYTSSYTVLLDSFGPSSDTTEVHILLYNGHLQRIPPSQVKPIRRSNPDVPVDHFDDVVVDSATDSSLHFWHSLLACLIVP